MTSFWSIFGDWGYALAAALFTALTIRALRQGADMPARKPLVLALGFTALWALHSVIGVSIGTAGSVAGCLVETIRNAAWIGVIWALLRESETGLPETGPLPRALPMSAMPVFIALIVALACQLPFDFIIRDQVRPTPVYLPLFHAAWALRAVVAVGSIVLLRSLFARLARERARQIGWLGCGLTILWAYEFHHYVLAWISDGHVMAVGQMRGAVMAAIAPLIALGTSGAERRSFALSRPAVYRAITIGFGLIYALALLMMIMMVHTVADPTTRIVQLGAMFALSVIALVLLPSAPFRSWLRVEIAKHLFAHRYDYRREWTQYVDALGGDDSPDSTKQDDALSLRRAARAIASAVASPAAILLIREEDGSLSPGADWNWSGGNAVAGAIDTVFAQTLERSRWIVDIQRAADPLVDRLPGWITADRRAWALAPLIHRGTLIGAVLLARPIGRKDFDWEDLDMLRVVARQLAGTLSERQHQKALAEAQRFDEFNRRFAFILHDIKNMVSQISLLAGNAERHAENPAFRADMVLTLRETADRMNDLITRLARPSPPRTGEDASCDIVAIAQGAAATGIARGRVSVEGVTRLTVRGDAAGLRQAIGHLVQNAVEATPADGDPVRIVLGHENGYARIDIIDRGCGMGAEFLKSGLFRPFSSTKAAGFGLGAHEARALIAAMGGRLLVESAQGEGTTFTLFLPLAVKEEPTQPMPSPPISSLAIPQHDRKTG